MFGSWVWVLTWLYFAAVVAYQLCLKMGDVLGDGTEGNVFIQLFGDKGMTEQIQLRQAGNSKIRFEKGRTYKFTVETIDIGKVRSLWHYDSMHVWTFVYCTLKGVVMFKWLVISESLPTIPQKKNHVHQ